jgi:hypothetical protein
MASLRGLAVFETDESTPPFRENLAKTPRKARVYGRIFVEQVIWRNKMLIAARRTS